MEVRFFKLQFRDRFFRETHGLKFDNPTVQGRLWEKINRQVGLGGQEINCQTCDELYPQVEDYIRPQELVTISGCHYCDQINYISLLEWALKLGSCDETHIQIENAIHYTYGVLLNSPTCAHQVGTEWDVMDEGGIP